MAPRVRVLDSLMRPRRHERPHAHPRVRPRGIHIDNILQHGVVQQKAVNGPVAPCDEIGLETALVEPLNAGFAAVAGAEKLDVGVGVVGEEVYDLFLMDGEISSGDGW